MKYSMDSTALLPRKPATAFGQHRPYSVKYSNRSTNKQPVPTLYVVKIGGNIIDDEKKLASFLKDFAALQGQKILIHGGGKLATKLAEQMNVPQQMIDGRRITDAETL